MASHELTGPQFTTLLKQDPDKAISVLFQQYHALVYTSIYRLVLTSTVAEDLSQELFLRLVEGSRTVQTNGPLGSYLRRMAVNMAIDYLRSERAVTFSDVALVADEPTTTADAALLEADLQQALQTALRKLPPRCATIFSLSRFEQLSYAEIADQLNISRNTVENQMVKALKILRVLLRDHLPVIAAAALLY